MKYKDKSSTQDNNKTFKEFYIFTKEITIKFFCNTDFKNYINF